MAKLPLTTLILAAGTGTRMRSSRPKVMFELAGKPLLLHVIRVAEAAQSAKLGVVIGPDHDEVRALIETCAPKVHVAVQENRLGTAHAVLQAEELLKEAKGHVLVIYGDTPLLRAETLLLVSQKLSAGADVVIGAFKTENPAGYGRIIQKGEKVIAIREEKDASAQEKTIKLVNGGVMGFRSEKALALIQGIGNKNKAKEYYLTEAVALANAQGLQVDTVLIPEEDTLGVNTRAQLAVAEQLMQQRLRKKLLENGVTLVAPESVFIARDAVIEEDVTIAPYVVIGPGVKIGRGTQILSFSHLEGAVVGKNARIGPFARLRPGTVVGEGAHVGNFVEINRSTLGSHVDVNHLTYLGDTEVGQGTNVGAGTITCNFDGAMKFKTKIGADVFVGSNTTLVAPLNIGNETLIAAGSIVTKDVPAGNLVFGRVKEQVSLPDRGAQKIRANKKARAARKAKEKL
jgi:bifunctional UDP-N-acetylglucosamine pyrophosphorylase/glucosamine-1-phosphate N-acetyltransferase